MRTAVTFAVLLVLAGPLAEAATTRPQDRVSELIHRQNCTGLVSQVDEEQREAVRRDPATHVPLLLAWVTLERIEAAGADPIQLIATQNAAALLVTLGGNEGREALVARLKELQRKRDEVSAEAEGWVRRSDPAHPPREQAPFRELLQRIGRLSRVESTIVGAFADANDPRLRDLLLARIEQDDLRDRYVEYFEATSREDPAVRARLRKLLESPAYPGSKIYLQRFFGELK